MGGQWVYLYSLGSRRYPFLGVVYNWKLRNSHQFWNQRTSQVCLNFNSLSSSPRIDNHLEVFWELFTIGNFEIVINSEINVHHRYVWISTLCRVLPELIITSKFMNSTVWTFVLIEFSLGGAFFWLLFSIFNHPGYVRLNYTRDLRFNVRLR